MCETCNKAVHQPQLGMDDDGHEPLSLSTTRSTEIVDKVNATGIPVLDDIIPAAANKDIEVTPEQLDRMEEAATYFFAQFLESLGVDWRNDPNSNNTPHRVAKSYVREMWGGRYQKFDFEKLTHFPNEKNYDQMLIIGPLTIKSMCSHHHREITGFAAIGVLYGPGSTLIGLSKFSRIVDHFSRRGQIQEEFTKQLGETFNKLLSPVGLGVVVTCQHHCMTHRGVNEHNTLTTTSALEGLMREDAGVRAEFLSQMSRIEKQYFGK